MNQPKVAIIIVNYNGIQDTIECVESLDSISYKNYEIIIVENASGDREKILESTFLNSKATIIYSDRNDGFSGGNNLGIDYAISKQFDFVLLLNNDTTVEKNFLNELVQTAYEYNAAIVTGNIYFYYDKSKLWYSAGEYDFSNGITLMIGNNSNSTLPIDVSFSTGCLMLISRKTIEECGKLSDDFFLYSEDTEYCCRILQMKRRIVWNPKCVIYHKVSASTRENSPFQEYYLIRNNMYIIKKYCNKKFYAYMKRIWLSIKEIVKGQYKIKPLIDALYDFFNGKVGRSSRY